MSKESKWKQLLSAAGYGKKHGMLLGKVFTAYVGISVLLVALAGAAAGWQTYASVAPKESMKRMIASVSGTFLIDMLGMESQALQREEGSVFSSGRIGTYLAQLLLQVNPVEPRTFLASALPGFRADAAVAVAAPSGGPGEATDHGVDPSGGAEAPSQPPITQPEPAGVPAGEKPALLPEKLTTAGKKVVFVYHSHPRESWIPELGVKTAAEASDEKKNITLVGKRLADKLEDAGIGAVHSGEDYLKTVPKYNWNFSYKYSLQTVQDVFSRNKDIEFLFDIHRDSQKREITTAEIGGVSYAKVLFVVGKKNEKWEQNEAFAKRLHEKLEAEFPGISRGILDKGGGTGHAEYNQSVSPNSILIEFGGIYNTLEESYRTADVMAKAVSSLYWEAEKVNAAATASAKK